MLSMAYWRVGLLSVLALGVNDAQAEAYMASFDQAQWRVQSSPLACRLTQVVPRVGEATFETVGGGQQRFLLRAKQNPLAGGSTELTAAAPSWNPRREAVALGAIDVAAGADSLQLSDDFALRLLDSLRAGLVPTFVRPAREDVQESVAVALSPVNFRAAYRQYNACLGQLLPVTFDDVKTTVIEFAHEQSELSAAARKKIDFLLRYAAIDRSVTHFEIYGASSDGKRLLDNMELAKKRTQQVGEYLISRGIDAGAIATEYRGERGATGPRRFVSIRLKRSAAAS